MGMTEDNNNSNNMDSIPKRNYVADGPSIASELRMSGSADKSSRKSMKSKKSGSSETSRKSFTGDNLKKSSPSLGTVAPSPSSVQGNNKIPASEESGKTSISDGKTRRLSSSVGKSKTSPIQATSSNSARQAEFSTPTNLKSSQQQNANPPSLSYKTPITSSAKSSATKNVGDDDVSWSLMNLFNSNPANKICADCRTPLLEINRVHCSYYARNFLPEVGLCSTTQYNSIQINKRRNENNPEVAPKSVSGAGGRSTGETKIAASSPPRSSSTVEKNNSLQKNPNKVSNSNEKTSNLPNSNNASSGRVFKSFYETKTVKQNSSPSMGKENTRSTPRRSIKEAVKKSFQPRPPLHGVFICQDCSVAHRALGSRITHVASLASLISVDETTSARDAVTIILAAKGNSANNAFLEYYIPKNWKERRPNRQSAVEQREIFSRAKYELLGFAFLHGSVNIKSSLWNKILSGKPDAAPAQTSNISLTALPDRLLDYFCVVGPTPNDNPGTLLTSFRLTKASMESAEGMLQLSPPALHKLELQTSVLITYPTVPHKDTSRPSQLTKFVFPDGCTIATTEQPPRYFGFVLTLETGLRLYGHVLVVHDTSARTVDVLKALVSWSRDAKPKLSSESSGQKTKSSTSVFDNTNYSKFCKDYPLVFLPKAVVLLSHYPFHSQLRLSLMNLYRMSLVEAPLPMERFVANLVCEVPLPPTGLVRVRYSLSAELPAVNFERPPLNGLPMASFSYRPLFATLSVSNVLVLFGLLLQETSLVLCSSESVSLLFTVAEAITSLLFPLVWQGCYIPVLPREMLDVLHAPVPFLVGVHGAYLKEVTPDLRPPGIVFVDLDNDEIHLSTVDGGKGEVYGRDVPALPKKAALKLLSSIEESVGNSYLVTESGIKGRLTYGYGTLMENSFREEYAYEVNVAASKGIRQGKGSNGSGENGIRRAMALRGLDDAFPNEEHLMPIGNFLGEDGSKMALEVGNLSDLDKKSKSKRDGSVVSDSTSSKLTRMMRPKSKSSKIQASVAENTSNDFSSLGDSCHPGLVLVDSLLDADLDEIKGFSSSAIRMSFLRFFTSTFSQYDDHIQANGTFDQDGFLKSLPRLDSQYVEFLSSILESQMFHCLVEEKVSNPAQHEIHMFDESIIAKKNRSRKTLMKKNDTPFLTDASHKVRDVYVPPQPSNWGLPYDGTVYCYTSGFPTHLEESLFGSLRPPKKWDFDANFSVHASGQTRLIVNPVKKINSLLAGALSSNACIKDLPERDVVWAIHVMASKNIKEESPRKVVSPSVKRIVAREKNAGGKKQFADEEQNIAILSKTMIPVATRLLDSARKKQRKHVRQVIRIQCQIRIYLSKRQSENRAMAVFRLQRAIRISLLRRRYGTGLSRLYWCSRDIQRVKRGFAARRLFQRSIRSAIIIQSVARMRMYRQYMSLLIKWSIALQSTYRGRRTRFGYRCVLEVVACLQSAVRSWRTRQLWIKFRRQRIIQYRTQIFELWERAFRPLIFRTTFWKFYQGQFGFRHLAIHEEELSRLWVYLGLKPLNDRQETGSPSQKFRSIRESANVVYSAKLDDLGCQMGWKSQEVHQRFLIVQRKLDKTRAPEGKPLGPAFPEEMKGSERLFVARKQLMIERAEIYEKLKFLTTEETLNQIYDSLKIARSSKKKKETIVDMLWKSYFLITASSKVILMKGEHTGSSKRSKRARSLYETGKNQETITENLVVKSNEWVKERHNKRIRDIMVASTKALFSSVQFLLEHARSHNLRHADKNLLGGKTKSEIMQRFLSCHRYGNESRVARARRPRKNESRGVEELVARGLEINCETQFSVGTSVTSY